MHSWSVVVALVTGLALVASSTGSAGPLDPPPGPITGTLKPLSEVEPRIAINAVNTPGDADSVFRITQRGSYYLTGPLLGVAGKHGIEIAAGGVTVDLMGFEIFGGAGTLHGVTTSVVAPSVSVRNGSIRAWGQDGVNLATNIVIAGDIRDLRVFGCTGSGIRSGQGMTIQNCVSSSCGGDGIDAHSMCAVSMCRAGGSGGNGFTVGFASVITACVATGNDLGGFDIGSESVVSACTASQSTGHGFKGSFGCTFEGCMAASGGFDGFNVTAETILENCAARFNDGNGFTGTQTSNQFFRCSAVSNGERGIHAGQQSWVGDCLVVQNELDGIECAAQCVVIRNSCRQNGNAAGIGAGILAIGTDSRIEENTCSHADRGVEVTGAGNFIVRNICTANTTNWVIAANNVMGPILDRTAPASAAVNGNAGPSSLGSTDANANFTY